MLKRIYHIAIRECEIMLHNPIYLFCMVVFPLIVMFFFTSLLDDGQPVDMPIGVVDLDNTSTTRKLIRQLDAFQTSHVVDSYENMNQARDAIQKGEIYAFLLIPKGTTNGLINGSRPKISFYYSNVTLLAGGNTFKDLKTISTLGSAGVGMAKLSALGKTDNEIRTFLQPIAVDAHMIANPWANYNVYLSTVMIPGVLMLFIFLLTPYSIGTELKFKRSREWMKLADNNVHVAVLGKILPHFVIFLTIFYAFEYYIYYVLGFPHSGGIVPILLLGFLAVVSAQGFGIFVFGLMPSLRMSMSVCSLWAVLSLSVCGATYPLFAMDSVLVALGNLFPLRHYYMIYQMTIFNGYPMHYAALHFGALILFAALPILSVRHIKTAMLKYIYMP